MRSSPIILQPTTFLTFLLRSPSSPSFHSTTNRDPPYFSTSQPCIVPANAPTAPEKAPDTFYIYADVKRLLKAFVCGLPKISVQPAGRVLAISPDNTDVPIIWLESTAAGAVFVGRAPYTTA